MLGRHADQFFRRQSQERVLAQPPNGESSSIEYFDRGDRGTGQIRHVPGYYETPGPQNAVDANTLAGAAVGENPMPPATAEADDGNGNGFSVSDVPPWAWVVGAGALYYLFVRGNSATPVHRKRRRRSAKRRSA